MCWVGSMCEFKFCRGSGACFLSETSPCPGKCPNARPGHAAEAADRAGLSYKGFLDRDFVLAALGDEKRRDVETVRGLPHGPVARPTHGERIYRVA